MDRRPAPPRHMDEVLTRLCEPNTRGERVFESKQKAMMFAAALGFSSKRRLKIDLKAPGIRYEVFQSAFDDAFVDALAVAETGSLEVLDEERADERIEIFEEYAHGGLEEMQRICFAQEGDPVDNLIRCTMEVRMTETEIPGIDAGVLRDLLG